MDGLGGLVGQWSKGECAPHSETCALTPLMCQPNPPQHKRDRIIQTSKQGHYIASEHTPHYSTGYLMCTFYTLGTEGVIHEINKHDQRAHTSVN